MPNLLFLTQRIPYPPFKGEKIRAWRILQYLAQSYDVHLGCLVDDRSDDQHIPTVSGICKDSYFAKISRRRATIKCTAGLLIGEPLSVAFYRDRGLTAWVRRVMTDVKPDVVFVFSSNMAPYILDLPGSRQVRIVDLVDVDSEKWRAYARNESGPMRWVHAREARLIARLEARIARECDWSMFVSSDEARLFAGMVPDYAAKVLAISNGVDSDYFDPGLEFDTLCDATVPNYVFTGTMDYAPNVEAVSWFAKSILPSIRVRQPHAQFHIVGANPTPQVIALASAPGVHVTGRVADVRPYLAYATAAVVPMKIARGIQNKVLEAMAMARPVVVTSDALEGVEAVPGTEVLLANGADEFASMCLLAIEPASDAIGRAARRRVLADYDWNNRLHALDALLQPQGVATTAI